MPRWLLPKSLGQSRRELAICHNSIGLHSLQVCFKLGSLFSLHLKMCLLFTGLIHQLQLTRFWSVRKLKRLNIEMLHYCVDQYRGRRFRTEQSLAWLSLEQGCVGLNLLPGLGFVSLAPISKYGREVSRPDIAFDVQDNGDGTTSTCVTGQYYNGCTTYPSPVST